MAEHPVQGEELQAFLDRQLDAARRAQVAGHSNQCAECRTMLAELEQVSEKLRRWEIEPAPASLKPPVLHEDKTVLPFSWRPAMYGAAAGLSLILVIAALSVSRLLRSPEVLSSRTYNVVDTSPYVPDQADKPEFHSTINQELNPRAVKPEMAGGGGGGGVAHAPDTVQQLIAYEVRLTVEVREFESAKNQALALTERGGGYVAESKLSETPRMPRRADLVLRVPAKGLKSILDHIRALGRVTQEQLSTEEVTEQVVDLEARLRNARATEERLIAVLRERTGKVKDILEVEREIARTREEIERMEGQSKHLMRRVEMATIYVTLAEEFKAQLEPAPVGALTELHNAAVGGYRSLVDTLFGLVLFLARYGLTLVFWLGIGWLAWRRLGRRLVAAFQRS
jgi:hypothetical protein